MSNQNVIGKQSPRGVRAVDDLRRRELELVDFIENAPIGLHWVDADGVILWANQAELDLLGYTREEYIGRPLADMLSRRSNEMRAPSQVPIYQNDDRVGRVHPAARDTLPILDCPERLDGMRVLVVDDERDTRELLRIGLEQCGAEVTAVGTGREALEYIGKEKADLLISDIGMPDEDGYELIKKITALPAERGGKIPAIALTAYARTEDRLRALRASYQMHVTKPLELAELVAVMASLVQRNG
jgi:CheY-like chemotaxis protein